MLKFSPKPPITITSVRSSKVEDLQKGNDAEEIATAWSPWFMTMKNKKWLLLLQLQDCKMFTKS